MDNMTHIKQIIPGILKEAVKKQSEEQPAKMLPDNRRRISEFLERIGGGMPGGGGLNERNRT